jgi:hypothetical protein
MGRDVWRDGHWGPGAEMCWFPTDDTAPMPGVCLRCYVLNAPSPEKFARRVRIAQEYLDIRSMIDG